MSFFENSRGTVGRAHNVSRSGLYIETSQKPPRVGIGQRAFRFDRAAQTMWCSLHARLCVIVRQKPGQASSRSTTVVDELGRTGIFRHFINQYLLWPEPEGALPYLGTFSGPYGW